MLEWDWRRAAGTFLVPTLILHGQHDPLPLEGSREWAAALPQAELVVFDSSGHWPHIEEPQKARRVVDAFLARWPARRGGGE